MSAQPVVFESGHSDMIHDAQLDHYGRRLLTASSDHSIRVFEVSPSGEHILSATLAGHDGPVWQVAWAHPRFGQVFASCGYDCRIAVWREQAPGIWSKVWEDESHAASVNSLAFAPHSAGLVLAAGSSDGSVSIWTHCQDQSWARELIHAHKGGVSSVSWAPTLKADGADAAIPALRLATGGCDNAVRVWRRASPAEAAAAAAASMQQQQQQWGAHPHHQQEQQQQQGWIEVKTFEGGRQSHSDWVRDVAWAPALGGSSSTSTIASCSEDKTVGIWTEASNGTWRLSKSIPFAERPWRVSWSLMGDVLAVAQADNTVSLWHQGADGQWTSASTLGAATNTAPTAGAAAVSPAAQ